jgi:membrane protein YqaA with SNARE-associated domain
MNSIIASLAALFGTLLGAVLTYIFQARNTRQAQKFTQAQQFRQENQKKWKSGWPSCHKSMTTLPMMLEPLIGPQKRLSQEIARLSPIT